MIRLEYEVTPADFEAFNLHVAYRPEMRAERRRRYWTQLIFFPLAVPGIAVLLPVEWLYDPTWLIGGATIGAFLGQVVMIWIAHARYPRHIRASLRQTLVRNPRESFLGPQRLEAGEAGLAVAGRDVDSLYRWPAVAGIEEGKAHLFVMIGSLNTVILPKRGQDAAVLAALRALVAASATSHGQVA